MMSLDGASNKFNLTYPNPDPEIIYLDINPLTAQIIDEHSSDVAIPIFDLRKASECHKIVRKNIQEYIKPGVKLLDICNRIEDNIVKVFGKNNLEAGIAFPTGISLNNTICHDTANPNDERVLKYDDICKVDFGTHVNGYIIDSAFSVTFNQEYKPLLEAAKESMWAGIKMAGPDVLINDISEEIKEVIESYEVTIKGKTYPIKPIKDLGGHNIKQYMIHAGKLVLCAPCLHKEHKDARMETGEQYAIETYPSTGTGIMKKNINKEINHFEMNADHVKFNSKLKTTKNVYNFIKNTRSTLPFTQRWLQKEFGNKYRYAVKDLMQKHVLTAYPLLEDIKNSYTAQFEHTLYIHDFGKEILSAGDDY